jgi:aspartyl/glutamyl-tRNA(Asn/Gln) amidotransferase C subunit
VDLPNEALAHVARLARLKLTDDELARLGADIRGILTLFDRLEEGDGDASQQLPPTAVGAPRPDETAPPEGVADILANVPRVEAGRIRVERGG